MASKNSHWWTPSLSLHSVLLLSLFPLPPIRSPWNKLLKAYHALINWSEWRAIITSNLYPYAESIKHASVPLLPYSSPLLNIFAPSYRTSLLLSHAFRSCKHCYSTRYYLCHQWLSLQRTLLWLCCSLLSIHWLLFYLCFSGSCQASCWWYCVSRSRPTAWSRSQSDIS